MKKAISLLLALALLLAVTACGTAPSSSAPSSVVSSSSAPASSSVSALPEPEPEPEPVTRASILTGLEVPLDYAGGHRIAAVVVGNISSERPSRGLSDAQIVFELPVEGGVTRLMALYEDYQSMPVAGPVRSSRDSFLQLAMPFQPIFVSAGGSQTHDQYIDTLNWNDQMLDGRSSYNHLEQDTTRKSSIHTFFFTDGPMLQAAVDEANIDNMRSYNSTFFSFVPYGDAPRQLTGGAATSLQIVLTKPMNGTGKGAISTLDYDIATGRWLLGYTSGSANQAEPAIDETTDQQLAFDNVLALFAEMPLHEGLPIPDIQFGHGGVGYYFNGGHFEKVRWFKDSALHGLRIVNFEDGETPVALNPGTSYVAFADVDQAQYFAYGNPGNLRTLGEMD